MPPKSPGPQSNQSPEPPFGKRLKIGLLAGLVVGLLRFVIILLAVGVAATDALLFGTILAVFVLLIGTGVLTAATARGHGSVLYGPGSRKGDFGGNFSHRRLNPGSFERLIRPSHGQIETCDRDISLALVDRFRVMNAP